jgi:hypothetical protein
MSLTETDRVSEMEMALTESKQYWEEQIAYFPVTAILVSDTINRNKTVLCARNEVSKTIQFGRLQCWYY